MRISRKLKKRIPGGNYCYEFVYSRVKKGSPVWDWPTRVCPFYFRNSLGNGDCRYLVKKHGTLNGEEENFDFCLDDQCKSCSFKQSYRFTKQDRKETRREKTSNIFTKKQNRKR